jgi:hypothetical protein
MRLPGRSFGYGFNNAQGGVFALLWDTAAGMSMWHFARADIPADLTAQKPNPSTWGTPAGFWSAQSCDISANFYDHQMVIDTTLCGNWAGGSAYSKSGCPGTCTDMIANATNYVGMCFTKSVFFSGGSVVRCRCKVGHQLRCCLPVNMCLYYSYCITSTSYLLPLPAFTHIPRTCVNHYFSSITISILSCLHLLVALVSLSFLFAVHFKTIVIVHLDYLGLII